ncbi:MAG: class I SAM-dependent methyltransferase [Proteobacteria bacterium]|nr:class I SAM-dependent methyltransferase [Pseudomonadota bacterium]
MSYKENLEHQKNYTSKLNEYYSDSYNASMDHKKVKWGSQESQFLRFKILSEISNLFFESSILDYGCGIGTFLEFLIQHHYSGSYTGYDILPSMLEIAQKKYKDHLFTSSIHRKSFDFVIASGIFTIADSKMMHEEIQKMYQISQKGVAFNCLSSFASQQEKGEFYANPLKTLEFCFNLTPKVVLKHHYLPHDFTIYMYK